MYLRHIHDTIALLVKCPLVNKRAYKEKLVPQLICSFSGKLTPPWQARGLLIQ